MKKTWRIAILLLVFVLGLLAIGVMFPDDTPEKLTRGYLKMNHGLLSVLLERCGSYPQHFFVKREEVPECFGNKEEYFVSPFDANGRPFLYKTDGKTFEIRSQGPKSLSIDETGVISTR